ncbi:MAG: hypothetical protein GY810_23025 [Aureispira sp.]|nr:hypothetical protein [Aureispira sp.]
MSNKQPSKPEILSSVGKKFGLRWEINLHKTQQLPAHKKTRDTNFLCGYCAQGKVQEVGNDGCGSVGGGTEYYEVHCDHCGYYTNYQRDWG